MNRLLAPCDTCNGFGTVTIARDTGVVGTGYFYEETCPDCEGSAECEVLCPYCDNEVDDTGFCKRCNEVSVGLHPRKAA
jgi:DnaJ-class molecular chaperone